MNDTESRLKNSVRGLFSEGNVDLVIGYRKGSLPLRTTPCFITGEDEVEALVWNAFCTNNLAVYLPSLFGPDPRTKERGKKTVGIVAKGCDCRSIVGHIKEKQVPKENLVIIGIPCEGMVDHKKVEAELEGREIVRAEEAEHQIVILDDDGQESRIARERVLRETCLVCQYLDPPIYDILIGGKSSRQRGVDEYADVLEFEGKSADQRWAYSQQEMDKCIRCYACRNACPLCYCDECFAEQSRPRWVGVTNDSSDIGAFHLGRIFHTAGRCVDCGACEAACPMGIHLRKLTRKIVKDVEELFGYKAGRSLDESSPLATYKLDDYGEFVS